MLLLSGGNKTNAGSLAASGGGILRLQAFVDNTGGTIDPNDGLVELNLATVTGGSITAGQVDVIGSSTLNTLSTAADIDVLTSQSLTVNGTITNTGTITVNNTAGAGNAILDPNSAVTFTGAGDVVLNAGGSLADAQVGGAANDFIITNAAGHTFRGAGQIINEFTNNGLVSADSSGNTLLLSGGLKTNNNVLNTANGGTLQIATTVNNGSGSIDPNAGLVELSGATINGGSITAGQVDVIATSTVDGVATAADIDVLGGRNLNVTGTITNTGTITINSNGSSSNSILDPNTDVTFAGAGQVVLNAIAGDVADAQVGGATNDFIITNDVDHTFRGAGQIINQFINNGLVSADMNGFTLLLSGGNKTNTATLEATGGGNLQITTVVNNLGGSIDANGGTVQLAAATINQGDVTGGQVNVTATSTFSGVTNSATVNVLGGANLNVNGTITNTGSITINSNGVASNSILDPTGTATFSGAGEVVLNATSALADAQVGGATNDFQITNAAGHTFRGTGQIINLFVNDGLVSADVNGATLLLSGGVKTNNGTYEALDGATFSHTAALTNLAAGTLTGGTYRSIEIGNGSTVAILGTAVDTISTDTMAWLSGTNAVMTFGGINLADSLVNNSGTLRIFDGHVFTMANALNNSGEVFLSAGRIGIPVLTSGGDITNAAGAEIFGNGMINNTILNSGTVRSANGTLAIVGGVIDGQSGTIQSDVGSTLDLSAASGDSDGDFLVNHGSLNLCANNVLVGMDYTNAGFGVGNAFNHRANVTGGGQILADPAVTQSLTGDVTNGATATATTDFGATRVGVAVNRSYSINNGGASGPALRGAIQTDNSAGNGGNLTSGDLSGAGVTAANFGPIAVGASEGPLAVTYTPTTAGALSGQQVAIVNNFDNVVNQVLQFTGTAYNPAIAGVTPATVNFGIVHVGDTPGPQAITIANTAAAGAFSEDLLADNFAATGDASIEAGSPTSLNLIAGATDNTLAVSIDTSTAGAKSGTLTLDTTSTGEVNGSAITGLAPLDLGGELIQINAQVNNFAVATVQQLSGAGSFSQTGADEYLLDFGLLVQGDPNLNGVLGVLNDVLAPADTLAGSFNTSGTAFAFAGFGAFTGLAAGNTQGGLSVTFDTSNVGAFSGQILFDPRSQNASGFDGPLGQVVINLTGEVAAIPEPSTWLLLGVGIALLAASKRRR